MKLITRISLLIIIVLLLVLFFVFEPGSSQLFPRCPFNALTGYYCPGCGSQRAIHGLLHLNISSAVNNNLLILPALLVILYHHTYRFLNQKLGLKLPALFYYKITPWIIFGIIMLFWILRNLPFYPFTFLAPN